MNHLNGHREQMILQCRDMKIEPEFGVAETNHCLLDSIVVKGEPCENMWIGKEVPSTVTEILSEITKFETNSEPTEMERRCESDQAVRSDPKFPEKGPKISVAHNDVICEDLLDCLNPETEYNFRKRSVVHKSASVNAFDSKDDECRINSKKSKVIIEMDDTKKAKPFQCRSCHKAYIFKSSYCRHMKLHSKKKPYKCSLCKAAFARRDVLTVHFRSHSIRPYECVICYRIFKGRHMLAKHKCINFTKGPRYVVNSLNVQSTSNRYQEDSTGINTEFTGEDISIMSNGLKDKLIHSSNFMEGGSFIDGIIQAQPTTNGKLVKEDFNNTALVPNSFVVNNKSCVEMASVVQDESNKDVEAVLNLKSGGETQGCNFRKKFVTCRNNKEDDNDSTNGKSKIQKNDPTKKPFKCFSCHQTFSFKSTYSRHKKQHSKQKPYKCFLCKAAFGRSDILRIHFRTHERAFECATCNKTFESKRMLTQHKCMEGAICIANSLNVQSVTSQEDNVDINSEFIGETAANSNYCHASAAADQQNHNGSFIEGDSCINNSIQGKSTEDFGNNALQSSFVEKSEPWEDTRMDGRNNVSLVKTQTETPSESIHSISAEVDFSFVVQSCETLRGDPKPAENVSDLVHNHLSENFHDDVLLESGCRTQRYNFRKKSVVYRNTNESDLDSEENDWRIDSKTNKIDVEINARKKTFRCHSCRKAFSCKKARYRHMQQLHRNVKSHKCSLCKATFGRKEVLNNHLRTHSDDRPFKCVQCDKSYKHKQILTRHNCINSSQGTNYVVNSSTIHSRSELNPELDDVIKTPFTNNSSTHVQPTKNLNPETHIAEVDVTEAKRLGQEISHYVHNTDTDSKLAEDLNIVVKNKPGCESSFVQNALSEVVHKGVNLESNSGYNFRNQNVMYKEDDCDFEDVEWRLQMDDTKKKLYKCNFCSQMFTFHSAYSRHKKLHTKVKPYKCSICQATFGRSDTLHDHYRSIHSSERPYKCVICEKTYKIQRALRQHINSCRRLHDQTMKDQNQQFSIDFKAKFADEDDTQICLYQPQEDCDGIFMQRASEDCVDANLKSGCRTRRYNFRNTSVVYRNDDLEDDNCKTGSNLEIITDDTKDGPFKCPFCPEVFIFKGGCYRHIKLHSKEKPHKCQLCKAAFRGRSALSNHFKTHRRNREFKCVVCTNLFTTKKNLKQHLTEGNSCIKNLKVRLTRVELTSENTAKTNYYHNDIIASNQPNHNGNFTEQNCDNSNSCHALSMTYLNQETEDAILDFAKMSLCHNEAASKQITLKEKINIVNSLQEQSTREVNQELSDEVNSRTVEEIITKTSPLLEPFQQKNGLLEVQGMHTNDELVQHLSNNAIYLGSVIVKSEPYDDIWMNVDEKTPWDETPANVKLEIDSGPAEVDLKFEIESLQTIGPVHTEEYPESSVVFNEYLLPKNELSEELNVDINMKAGCETQRYNFRKTPVLCRSTTDNEDDDWRTDLKINESVDNVDETGCRQFRCFSCNRTFAFKSSYYRHIKTHDKKKSFRCSICEASFTRSDHLNQHSKIHSAKRTFICLVCKKSFKTRRCLSQHMLVHTVERKLEKELTFTFGSEFCKQIVTKPQKKIKLISDSSTNCEICGKFCKSLHGLNMHRRIHINKNAVEIPYNCPKKAGENINTISDACKKTFPAESRLGEMVGLKECLCETCGKCFLTEQCRSSHICTRTSVESCNSHCDKTFYRKSNLHISQYVDTIINDENAPYIKANLGDSSDQDAGVKSIQCIKEDIGDENAQYDNEHIGEINAQCVKTENSDASDQGNKAGTDVGSMPFLKEDFGDEDDQNLDVDVRKAQRQEEYYSDFNVTCNPYRCEICNTSYFSSQELDMHLRSHGPPLTCNVCDQSFSYASDYYLHIRIHRTERPYK